MTQPLTDREIEVCREYLKTDSSKIAGAELHISDSMVRRHFRSVRNKTGIMSRARLAELVSPSLPPRLPARRSPRVTRGTETLTLWNLGES